LKQRKQIYFKGSTKWSNRKKARYLAVNKINVNNAFEVTKNTGVGIMGETGRIVAVTPAKRAIQWAGKKEGGLGEGIFLPAQKAKSRRTALISAELRRSLFFCRFMSYHIYGNNNKT